MTPSSPGTPASSTPTTFHGLTLFPFQRQALAAIFEGRSVVVAAPTGAGKTLVADFAIEQALTQERRVVYTSPIKALSNQKFRDFREQYGEDAVGLMTGDVTMQPEAPLLIMTTEIFRNTIFEDPARLNGFDFVIFDECHYLDDRDRGTVWEEAIIFAPPHIRIVALSATVPNVAEFAAWIEDVRDVPVDVIVEETRPVPLIHKIWIPGRGPRSLEETRKHFIEMGRIKEKREERRGGRKSGGRINRKAQARAMDQAGDDLLDYLTSRDLLPAIYFCFSRRDCARLADRHAARTLLSNEDRDRMLSLFDDLAARYEVSDTEETRALRGIAARGVLYHHAGMLPIYKEIVERLFTTGLVRLLFATETFALGVNMPARSVCFHALTKYNGIAFGPLMAREYWQMAGRAGRQGIDDKGYVFALLDDSDISYHNIEWLQSGKTEPVRSRFNLNYSAVLNLFERLGEDVPKAWERSFARFVQKGKKPPHRGRRGQKRPVKEGVGAKQIRARLQVLRDAHYIEGDTLTRKGELCRRVNGYEIAVTEAYDGGFLFRCDAVEAAILFAAMVYESRPADASAPSNRKMRGVRFPFLAHMEAFGAHERELGVRSDTRPPDFGISGLVERWAEGIELETILDHTTLAAGDFVRVLRMTIQLLRQAAHALPKGDPCIAVLHEAKERLDRDEVDARRQLELG
jgi:superfamily II RNA helicase